MKRLALKALLISLGTLSFVCASEASAFSDKGRVTLEGFLKNGEVVFADGDPRRLNDRAFQENASCQAYFMMKMWEEGGVTTDNSVNARSGNHYFLANLELAEAKNYDSWEVWTYVFWDIQTKGRDALAGNLARPANCAPVSVN
ncbi:hypothetical protein [Rhizobium flavescens]|uniref:hypothetical protein n=1 Tax=Rhizobium flavescens TaxID=2607407 RepID=UPI00140923AE|nr:hypothetical protein [Rhizobium flavescens]